MIKWILVITILALIVLSSRFRRFAVIFILIASILGISLWQYQEYERNKSKSSILPSELTLQNMEFKPLDKNHEFQMTGLIINNSEKYTLKSITLTVTTQECNTDRTNCLTVSEQQENVYITVPPHQARYFKKDIYLYSNQDVKNDLIWGHSIRYAISE